MNSPYESGSDRLISHTFAAVQKELYVIRHGETEFNKLGIVQGRGVNPSLNETGKQQASLFYSAYKNEGFEIIYTSLLKRSHETIAAFVNDGIPWEQYAALDEISWGVYEGQPATLEFKHQYKNMVEEWNAGHLYLKAPDGESPLEVQQRQKEFIEYLVKQPARKILICMHGRAMRIFLPTLLNLDLTHMDDFPHHNLTLYKLTFAGNRFNIELFNNMDHLHVKQN